MDYTVSYDGYGVVETNTSLRLAPKQAKQLSITHAALAHPVVPLSRDFDITVVYSTDEYLRLNNPPNVWEVFWLFFNYRIDPTINKKECNYFILKPNGCELGTASQELAQVFIATTNEPQMELRKKYILRIVKYGSRVQVYIDHELVMDAEDERFYDHEGQIGFYSEDADCSVYSWDFVKLR